MKLFVCLALIATPAIAEEFPALKDRSEIAEKALFGRPTGVRSVSGIQVKKVVRKPRLIEHEFDDTREDFRALLEASGCVLPPARTDTEIRVISIKEGRVFLTIQR